MKQTLRATIEAATARAKKDGLPAMEAKVIIEAQARAIQIMAVNNGLAILNNLKIKK